MASGSSTSSGGQGERQRRAAQLRAEMEAKQAASGDPAGQGAEQQESAAGPVGTGDHVVRDGDCISSIAKDTGHFWETIWYEPANAELRDARKDPNVLLAGDRVAVPLITPKEEPGESEQLHRFVRKGQPEMLRVRILRDGTPRINQPYTVEVAGAVYRGNTDATGKLQCPIPPNARRANLAVGTEPDIDEYELELGRIDPISELSGVQGRLNNLGFDCGAVDGRWGPRTERALRDYQKHCQLEVTGQADDETRRCLQRDYGC